MKAISVISLMPSTRDEISNFVAKLKLDILESDPLQAATQIAAIEKTIRAIRQDDEIRNHILDELAKYPKGNVVYQGNELQTCETGVKYDYQDDHELQRLAQEKLSIDNAIKDRQKLIKALKASIYDAEGIEIKPAVKSSTTNYKIIIK